MSDKRASERTNSTTARRSLLALLGLGAVGALTNASTPVRAQQYRLGRYLDDTGDNVVAFTGPAEWGNTGRYTNDATGPQSVVGGGVSNDASAFQTTVSGGGGNEATEPSASVGGGTTNAASARGATVSGGVRNEGRASYVAISGGNDNISDAAFAAIGGGESNRATGTYTTVSGGEWNRATGEKATVGGGGRYNADTEDGNSVRSRGGTIAGGLSNEVAGQQSGTVGGGQFNRVIPDEESGDEQARAAAATISGGSGNVARGNYSVVGGGNGNEAVGGVSTIVGGLGNETSGVGATVPGGRQNRASGEYSLAAGRQAVVDHDHTFAWSDGMFAGDAGGFASTGPNQFLVHAEGGVGIGTNAPEDTALRVQASENLRLPSGDLLPTHHMVSFEDSNNNRNVLALQSGQGSDELNPSAHFVSFYDTNDDQLGAIQGKRGQASGVTLRSRGADYAEVLPRRDADESLEPGDVVGVHAGAVASKTAGADRAMVVSGDAIVLGNVRPETADGGTEPVAFVGQVATKVRGSVESGDLVVPSGEADGVGVAVDPADWDPDEHGPLVGQVWEDDASEGVSEVTVAVGVEGAAALSTRPGRVREALDEQATTVAAVEAENEELREENAALRARLDALEERVAGIEAARTAEAEEAPTAD